jgi:acyl-CoA thioesterase YciA
LKKETDRDPAIRVVLLPRDTNGYGTIFGGIILSYIDQAGAVAVYPRCTGRLVTVAMREVEFHEPVFVGDLVSFYSHILSQGKTSITTKVCVEARRRDGSRVTVTEAEVVYVHVDQDRRPIPLPPEDESGKAGG